MASKKYLLTLALVIVSAIAFAQTNQTKLSDASFPWNDSAKVPTNKLPQYNQFLNNEYPYPARPRNMWELGLSIGNGLIVGDVPVGGKKADPDGRGAYNGGFAFGASLRKALGHVISLRGSLGYSIIHVPYYMNTGAGGSGVWGQSGVGIDKYGLTKTNTFSFSIDALASLNTISHYRGNPKGDFYVLGGYSIMSSAISYVNDPLRPTFPVSSFNNVISSSVSGNKATIWYHALDAGVGYSYKLSKRVNIGIEDKVFIPIPGLDYLDAVVAGNSNDLLNYATFRVNINLGNSAKRVEPLWWINPNNYVYNELNAPKHMKMPPVVLPDADGDGVPDQFDLEPNTPAGAQVDSHGRAIDTDGDGVPDYKDKEKLTPQNCFPVNSDGVGTCPEPACCAELRDKIANLKTAPACSLTGLPSIQFRSGSARLSKTATGLLDAAATSIKANPDCKVKVIGHPAASKAAQQLAYDRVDAVIKYLVTKQGIAEDRFIFSYDGGAGDANTIDLLGTTEDGPNTVPAPHPNLRTRH